MTKYEFERSAFTVFDIIALCAEPALCYIYVYSLDENRIIWGGSGDEIPAAIADMEVQSWDAPSKDGSITFNV